MKTMQLLKSSALVFCFMLISSSNVFADPYNFEWSFDDPNQIVGPNETVIMNATLTNTGTERLRTYGWVYDRVEASNGINSFSVSWGDFSALYSRSSLFTSAGFDLGPGESWEFEFYRLTPLTAVEAGVYSINYAHFHLASGSGDTYSVIEKDGGPFTATVLESVTGSPVPEPTTVLLFGAGLVGLAAAGRRRRK